MSTPKKILLTGLAVILLLGATPIAAQIAGVWEGTGKGAAYPPCHLPIYPWQKWIGEIPLTQDVFTGEWRDSDCNRGTFKSEIFWVSINVAIARGSWYWFNPTGSSQQPIYGGDFEMKFYAFERECTGTWTSIWPSPGPPGTMRGRKVH